MNFPAIAADIVLVLHAAFNAFVAVGGLLVLRRPWLMWLHLPCVAWGVAVEISGRVCPLTPLENHLRRIAGETGYAGDFIGHYLVPLIYPPGLTRGLQIGLGLALLALNAGIYAWLWHRQGCGRRR